LNPEGGGRKIGEGGKIEAVKQELKAEMGELRREVRAWARWRR